jgi:hypothetical protein
MNRYKFFKVKKITTREGKIVYVVFAASNILEVIFGMYDVFKKENTTLDEAVRQIEFLNQFKIESEETVYKKNL